VSWLLSSGLDLGVRNDDGIKELTADFNWSIFVLPVMFSWCRLILMTYLLMR
jgi:hypothetical protein